MKKDIVYTIEKAFCELMQKKELKKITVSDICSIANISRSTFYIYFDNTRQLLTDVEEWILADVLHLLKKWENADVRTIFRNPVSPMFLDICKYYYENIDFFRALFGPFGEEEFIFIYESHMYQDFLKKASAAEHDKMPSLVASACAGAMIAVSRSWAEHIELASPEEMARLQTAIVYRILFSQDQFTTWFSGDRQQRTAKEERNEPNQSSQNWNWTPTGKIF